jgi:hypothetical protein
MSINVIRFGHDTQRPGIGDGWAIYNFRPERLPVNEQKVEIMIYSSIDNFQSGTTAQ